MDLIYMNTAREDIGVLHDYELDLAFGSDENDFECKIGMNSHCLEAGYYLYIEGTEYGGIVDAIASDGGNKEVTYSGRTWQGILNSKVIEPDEGEGYLILSGEAHDVIEALLTRLGLDALFTVSAADSGLTLSSYKMDRYIGGYKGIVKMLASVDGKLLFNFTDGKVVLSAVPLHDYTQDEQFDSDLVAFTMQKSYKAVNHLICLGQGELAERTVIHLFADEQGNISEVQTQFGMDEITDVYDYSAVESVEELEKGGRDRLKELWNANSIKVDFDGADDSYDIGDMVGAYDNITKLSVAAAITKKIVTIKNGQTTISYKVGE